MTIRILYTKHEGGKWTPLHLHNVSKKSLLEALTDGVGNLEITKRKMYTVIKGITISDTIKPKKLHKKDLKFHSIMLNNGLIYDSTIGLDYIYYENRNFGLSAKRFEELWKTQSADAYNSWMAEIEGERKMHRLWKKRTELRKRKKNNE